MTTSVLAPPQHGTDRERHALPCLENDPELFFAETPHDVEVAKALCLSCPVRQECLAGALERAEPWGVWGGELFLQGNVIPRKRPRGRPRKTDAVAGADTNTISDQHDRTHALQGARS